jgi:2-dehydro-3-deoxyphosphogluconate aldolase / (4S)-4-hydroxy-2-oxoglutarate aldolase
MRLQAAASTGVVAIMRASSAEHCSAAAEVLADSGLTCVEIALTTPGALGAIADLRDRLPDVEVGAGTVTDAEQARAAAGAGARYFVTPTVALDVLDVAQELGVATIAGALTPTEILAAHRAGADAVKVFPVSSVGGVDYVRALGAPLPDIPLVPTGGIAREEVGAYLRAGSLAVGLGSSLLGDVLEGGSFDELKGRLAEVTRAVVSAPD